MKKINWINILERAAWTFIEAALGTLPAVIPLDLDKAAATSMIVAAVAAGLSAVKTLILEIARQHNEKSNDAAADDNGESEE